MKKTLLIIAMATLCLFFKVTAQEKAKKNPKIKEIKIGEKVPDTFLLNLHNYKNTTAKLSDFKGKLVILDFWATWCGACLSMFPEMKALEDQFQGKMEFIKISYEPEEVVTKFLTKFEGGKYNKQLHLTEDKLWRKYFPHCYLPHFVWIDQKGIVRAFTGGESVNEANIKQFLKGSDPHLPVKIDETYDYDWHSPFFEQNREKAEVKDGIFEPYKRGYKSGYYVGDYGPDVDSIQRITLRNSGILSLFKMAWGSSEINFTKSRRSLEVRDTTHFNSNTTGQELANWMAAGNAFSYEILFRKGKEKEAFLRMQKQLDDFFPQYECRIEMRNKLCWVLIRTDTTKNLKSVGGKPVQEIGFNGAKLRNVPFDHLFNQLDWIYLQNSKLPVLNETHLKANVDMDIDAPLYKIGALNVALKPYGLEFKKAMRTISVLVIKDRIIQKLN